VLCWIATFFQTNGRFVFKDVKYKLFPERAFIMDMEFSLWFLGAPTFTAVQAECKQANSVIKQLSSIRLD